MAPAPTAGLARNPTLDTLRGLLLVIIAVNHVPNAFHRVTQEPLGYMTAAEGFILISGLVVGLVSFKRWRKLGFGLTCRHLLRRTGMIYLAHLFCVVLVLGWMLGFRQVTGGLPVGTPWPWFDQPWGSLVATLTLFNQPGLLDVLPTYCLLLLMTPILLRGFYAGRMGLTLGISGGVWLVRNLVGHPEPLTTGVIHTGAFNVLGWQFLYALGLALGTRQAMGKALLPGWKPVFTAVAMALLLVLMGWRQQWWALPWAGPFAGPIWEVLVNKNNLGPVRLLNTLLIALLAWRFFALMPQGWRCAPLTLLGRHSLAVYTVHCLAAMVIIGFPLQFEFSKPGQVVAPLIMLVVIWLTAWIAQRGRGWRRGRQVELRPEPGLAAGAAEDLPLAATGSSVVAPAGFHSDCCAERGRGCSAQVG